MSRRAWRSVIVLAAGGMAACLSKPNRPDLTSDGSMSPDASIANYNIAFVTSEMHTAPALGGAAALANGDAICNRLAGSIGLPGTYRVYLSTATMPAQDRFASVTGGWVRPDGRPVAADLTQLTTGNLWYPIRLDELDDDLQGAQVITARVAGRFDLTYGDCSGYTSSVGNIMSGTSDRGWAWSSGVPIACSEPAHLYCLRTDGSAVVSAPSKPAQAPVAFVSSGTWAPQMTPDALCAADRPNAKAWLASATRSANDNVGSSGPWYRVDGVDVGTPDNLLAPINLDAQGTRAPTYVWTGAATPTAVGTSTCTGWTSTAGSGAVGPSDSSTKPFNGGTFMPPCSNPLPVYCVAP